MQCSAQEFSQVSVQQQQQYQQHLRLILWSVYNPGWRSTCPQIQAVAVAPAPAVEQKTYDAPKSLHGFELVRDEFVAEYDSRVLTYRHQKTGEHILRTMC